MPFEIDSGDSLVLVDYQKERAGGGKPEATKVSQVRLHPLWTTVSAGGGPLALGFDQHHLNEAMRDPNLSKDTDRWKSGVRSPSL